MLQQMVSKRWRMDGLTAVDRVKNKSHAPRGGTTGHGEKEDGDKWQGQCGGGQRKAPGERATRLRLKGVQSYAMSCRAGAGRGGSPRGAAHCTPCERRRPADDGRVPNAAQGQTCGRETKAVVRSRPRGRTPCHPLEKPQDLRRAATPRHPRARHPPPASPVRGGGGGERLRSPAP